MRRPTFYRRMNIREEQYAWDLFRGTLPPGNQIGIGDGLGLGDRPWTDTGSDPNSGMPFMAFQVNLGDMASMNLTSTTYIVGFGRVCDTLIHELTHVWQYYHGDFVKTSSVAAQAWEFLTTDLVISKQGVRREVTHDAYEYRPLDSSKSWDDYNAEQQAHIVEDWNYRRDKNNELYPFISEVIHSHGDPKARGQSLDELRSHLYFPDSKNAPPPPSTIKLDSLDGVLVPILEKRYGPNDIAGFGGRVKKLEEMFRGLDQLQAMALLNRLTMRKNGDQVSMYFYDHLSAATRTNLLGILRKASTGVMV
jgi:hypothetical protein